MKLILLNGASCSGKSTIIKNVMEHKKELFYLSYDYLKWNFSDYTSEKYRGDVKKIVLAIAKCIFTMNYDAITDSNIYKKEREKLIQLAHKMNYEVIEINFEANTKELLKRFDRRVKESSKNQTTKIANKSKKRFMEILSTFNKEKNTKAISFYTDKQSINHISKEILKLLKN